MLRCGARSVVRLLASNGTAAAHLPASTASSLAVSVARAGVQRTEVMHEGTRGFAGASAASMGHGHGHGTSSDAETIAVTFHEKDGSVTTVRAPIGQSMLEVAHRNDIELEGACEGSLACSTCHVIINEQSTYDQLPEPDDDENDMLDLAFGLTETSRLGCQVIASKELDGMVLSLPKATRNFAVDGFVPKPH